MQFMFIRPMKQKYNKVYEADDYSVSQTCGKPNVGC